jgi:hypothetical protein
MKLCNIFRRRTPALVSTSAAVVVTAAALSTIPGSADAQNYGLESCILKGCEAHSASLEMGVHQGFFYEQPDNPEQHDFKSVDSVKTPIQHELSDEKLRMLSLGLAAGQDFEAAGSVIYSADRMQENHSAATFGFMDSNGWALAVSIEAFTEGNDKPVTNKMRGRGANSVNVVTSYGVQISRTQMDGNLASTWSLGLGSIIEQDAYELDDNLFHMGMGIYQRV